MNAVSLEHLSKTYPDGKQAVDGISIALKPGEIFGFLGPNGAGKTTTVKLLNGMLTPTRGSCRIFGLDPAASPGQVHALSGVVTEHAQMYDNLTGLQNLVFYGTVFGLTAADSHERSLQLLTQLELLEAKDTRLGAYSTGMRQRLSLARALLHQPQVLFLDEPTSGLDPESAQNVHSMIRSLAAKQGITVFLCTHQLRYAQEICTRYGLMEEGRLLAEGTLEELRARVCSGMTVRIAASGIPQALSGQLSQEARPGAEGPSHSFRLPVRSEADIPRLVRQFVEDGHDIYHVSAQLPSLEDIYFTLTRKKEETP